MTWLRYLSIILVLTKNLNITHMSTWLNHQSKKDKTKWTLEMKKLWASFNLKHEKILVSNYKFWLNCYEEVIKYIKLYNKKPSCKGNYRKLYEWIKSQNKIYKKPNNKWSNEQKEKWEFFIALCDNIP